MAITVTALFRKRSFIFAGSSSVSRGRNCGICGSGIALTLNDRGMIYQVSLPRKVTQTTLPTTILRARPPLYVMSSNES